jgi:sugar phosphate isomerase/epimerase
MPNPPLSRRSFLALSAMVPWAFSARAKAFASSASIPVGLELYSVRESLKQDAEGTVRTVARMGYECVEFYSPYFDWTDAQAKQMKKLMDDLGIRCFSTHNNDTFLNPANISRTRELNAILGCKYVVLASSAKITHLDDWKAVADTLNNAAEHLESAGLKAGYHNHQAEFVPVDGRRPMELLAEKTKSSVMLQLDVGTCIDAGSDPVAWIRANPGRIRSIHCKDWSPGAGKGYTVLFGEGVADWKGIFTAAESAGGVEYYLVEQEGSRFSEFDTARKCLETFRMKHPA